MKINKEVKNQETEREVPVLLCWEWEGVAGGEDLCRCGGGGGET